jgi:hypothetical protein
MADMAGVPGSGASKAKLSTINFSSIISITYAVTQTTYGTLYYNNNNKNI